MNVTVLVENTLDSSCPGCVAEHGLSLYIETCRHRILVDLGAGENYAKNAFILGISPKDVDTVILSHGHNDHGGGLSSFLSCNKTAQIYAQRSAFEQHFGSSGNDISIACNLSPYVCLLNGDSRIDDELSVFTVTEKSHPWPRGNLKMKVFRNDVLQADTFDHEQYLVISQPGGNILFSGCAHNGILNILECYDRLYREPLLAVFSGFHMLINAHHYEPYTRQDVSEIIDTAKKLALRKTLFYTGHCTGEEAFNLMKPYMPDTLFRLSTGLRFSL